MNFTFIFQQQHLAYGVYIFQLIRYSRACGSYHDFFDRGLLLTRKLLKQLFLLVKLVITSKVLRLSPWPGEALQNKCVTRVTLRLLDQERLTLPVPPSASLVLVGFVGLDLFNFLCNVLYIIACPFGHFLINPSIYDFWLALWYLWFTTSD
jgi:hypothetical protein